MKQDLTTEEFEACQEVIKHRKMVIDYLNIIIKKLEHRGNNHDASKMESPEVEIFAEYTPKLKKSTYGSDEYKQFLDEMKPALDHHYAVNNHHPEHHKNGIDDMNLIDIVEMICDWKAATRKHRDGNILKSLEINGKRFNMSPQLISILNNTVKLFEDTP
jgi:hypothetical protein